MSTLEDQLRAALSARADAVTTPMLTRSLPTLADPEPDAAAVLLLPPNQQHRSRRLVATALAVAAVLLVAFGAVALHRSTHRFDPAHVRPRSAIPWDQVGPGWTLIQDAPHTKSNAQGNQLPDQLVRVLLIDPRGVQYLVTTLNPERWEVGDWSPRTERLLILPTAQDVEHNLESVVVFDLRTGNRQSITVPGNSDGRRFSGPDDQSILFESQSQWTVTIYSLTGQLQARFPGAVNAPIFTVDSADGTQIITGGQDGLVVRDRRTGQQLQTLAAPAGFSQCGDPFWEPHGELVADCLPNASRYGEGRQYFMFSRGSTLTPGRADRRLGPDTLSTAGLRQGYVMLAGNGNGVFSPAHTTVTLFDDSGNASHVEVPAAFAGIGWSALTEAPSVDTVGVVHSSSDGRQDVLDSWNPFTGEVTELYRASPTGMLVSYQPWRQLNG